MSFFGDLLKLAATAALFIATGPFGLSVAPWLVTALRLGGVALYYLSNQIDKATVALERQTMLFRTSLQPGTPIPVVYGHSKVGAVVADWFIETRSNTEILYQIVALCHGSRDGEGIDAIEDIWLNNAKAVTLTTPIVIETSSVADPTVITTATDHGLSTGDFVVIENHTGYISTPTKPVNGNYQITVTGLDTFTIPVPVSDGGTGGVVRWDTRYDPYTTGAVDFQVFLGADDQNVATTTLWGLRVSGSESIQLPLPSRNLTQVMDSGWDSDGAGAGLAAISFRLYNLSLGGGTPAFPSGPPSVSAVVSGVRVYDTRDDTWYPGGDNPALCVRDYLLSDTYGCGFDSTLIDDTSFEAAADYCDELAEFLVGEVDITSSSVASPSVITTASAHDYATGDTVRIIGHTSVTPDINGDHTITVTSDTTFTIPVNVTDGGTGGTVARVVEQKRFTCNGVVDTGQSTAANLQELLSSCRGQLVWEQGVFKLRIRSDDVASPTVTLTPNEILGQWSFRRGGLEEQYNLVTAAYIEPAGGEYKATQIQWPEVGVTNTYLSADASYLNRLDLSLPFTNDPVMALGIAQTVLKESRASLACSVVCTEAALALSVGDRVYVTHPTPDWTLKEFWVTALDLLPNHTVGVSLQEYDATAYAVETVPKVPRPIPPSLPAADEERRFKPTTRVKGAFPSYLSTNLYISWETTGESARIAVSTSGFPDAETGAVVGGSGANYDLGTTTADVYYYVTITPYSGVSGSGLPGEPQYLRTLRPNASDPGAPTLTSAAITDTYGGDVALGSEPWTHEVSWTTTSPNDGYYDVLLEYADNSGGTNWVTLASGLTTFSSSFIHSTGIAGSTTGTTPTVFYAKYRISVIRKSDSAVTDGPDSTSQASLTLYDYAF